jgi:hypothetical protein
MIHPLAYGLRILFNTSKIEKLPSIGSERRFFAKGGRPKDPFPIPMVLGSSEWLVEAAPDPEKHGEIRIPLSVLTEDEVSFTYPGSMISHWFGRYKPVEYYQAELHGHVFTLSEILLLVEKKGMPEEDWEPALPRH